jgi:hypothetical protein
MTTSHKFCFRPHIQLSCWGKSSPRAYCVRPYPFQWGTLRAVVAPLTISILQAAPHSAILDIAEAASYVPKAMKTPPNPQLPSSLLSGLPFFGISALPQAHLHPSPPISPSERLPMTDAFSNGAKSSFLALKLLMIFLLLPMITNVRAEGEKVLTIYFAGTKFTSDSTFGSEYPELISKLFEDDQSSNIPVTSHYNQWSFPSHDRYRWSHSAHLTPDSNKKYKTFINGVGVHDFLPGGAYDQCLFCAADGFWAGLRCRTYYVCLDTAIKAFEAFEASGSGALRINLIGFSRGGILTLMMADWIGENFPNARINIFAVDPVPGIPLADAIGEMQRKGFDFNLSTKLNQFIGIYAEDEMTAVFEPMLPQLRSNPISYILYSLRGGHETLVGNPDTSGHPGDGALPELRCVYNICRGTAEQIFGGPEWGNITFSQSLPETNNFITSVQAMNNHADADYRIMRRYTFAPLGFSSILKTIEYAGLKTLFWTPFPDGQAPERLIYRWPYDWPELFTDTIVFDLNQTPDEFRHVYYGSWVIVPQEQPIIESLYGPGYSENAYAIWYKTELLRGYPVPDVTDLELIGGECPFILPVPTATDVTEGILYSNLPGAADCPSVINQPGTYTVTWTYTDIDGNTSTQTQAVTATDTTPPEPDADPLPEVRGQCSVEIAVFPTATDTVAGTITGTTPDPLRYTEQGEYTVTWTYDDGYGNRTTQTQTVIVNDDTPPVIESISVTPSILWPPNHKMIEAEIQITTSDNCDSAPISRITRIACNELEGKKGPDSIITGDLTADLRAERSGKGTGRVYEITVECADKNGNSSADIVNVTVPKAMGTTQAKKSR